MHTILISLWILVLPVGIFHTEDTCQTPSMLQAAVSSGQLVVNARYMAQFYSGKHKLSLEVLETIWPHQAIFIGMYDAMLYNSVCAKQIGPLMFVGFGCLLPFC